jgi:membrane carboxypeptidase/penicillin-binding protein PbpC
VSNGAALVTKPNTGEILAMVGSRDFFNDEVDGKVNVTTRLRQPGSSIKPINYVTALQTKKLTPASVLLDIPTCFQVTGQPSYCPKNYDNSHHGPVSLRGALANSYNIPAVKVMAINSLETVIATASAMGISTFNDPSQHGLSLTLGGGEVTMLDMATAFGTLANQGVKVPLQPILKIEDYNGNLLEEYKPQETQAVLDSFFNEEGDDNVIGIIRQGLERVLNREPAYLISNILSDNAARTPAFGGNSELNIPGYEVAVKTGTTNDLRDNWTIGYTPQFLIASWVGNNDNTPMNPFVVSGVTGAAPIWNDIINYLLEDDNPQPVPSGVESATVCTLTGALVTAEESCQARTEYFWSQNVPSVVTPIAKEIWINKETGLPAFFPKAREEFAPEEVDAMISPDKLELQPHLVISDPFVENFCLDCPWPGETNEDGSPKEGGKIVYPIVDVNMRDFYANTRSTN